MDCGAVVETAAGGLDEVGGRVLAGRRWEFWTESTDVLARVTVCKGDTYLERQIFFLKKKERVLTCCLYSLDSTKCTD